MGLNSEIERRVREHEIYAAERIAGIIRDRPRLWPAGTIRLEDDLLARATITRHSGDSRYPGDDGLCGLPDIEVEP